MTHGAPHDTPILERDLRSADGELVWFHDATVDRVTDGHGRVNRRTLSDLRPLLVGGREAIPTLREALEACPDSYFTVDRKDEEAIEPLGRLLHHAPFAARVCVAGAWDSWLRRLRRLVSGVQTALGWRAWIALIGASRSGIAPPWRIATAPFAHVPIRLLSRPMFVERLVTHAHGIGIRLIVWTVDEPAVMHHLLDVGVDGIITDRPDVLGEVLIARGTAPPCSAASRRVHCVTPSRSRRRRTGSAGRASATGRRWCRRSYASMAS